jgi:translation initiation factor IF-3
LIVHHPRLYSARPTWRAPSRPVCFEAATGEDAIPRRPLSPAPVKKGADDGPRINEQISVPNVLLIDHTGEKRGVVPTRQAIELAVAAGLDLVEVSPGTQPPVCKILDFGKFKYQQQKKKAEARKKQKVVEIKEIKMRPNIDDHDYEVKAKAMRRFFEEGDKVKITLKFKGREAAHQDRGIELLKRVEADFEAVAKVEQSPTFEGKQVLMVLAPR